MKKIALSFLFFICFLFTNGQFISNTIYLIGDAGKNTYSGDALLALKTEILNNSNSTVLFLGDNIYPAGLDINDNNTILRIKSQLRILNEFKGNVFFIPGNHDWSAQKANGKKRLLEQQYFVERYIKDSTIVKNRNEHTFLPQNALPGPNSVLLAKGLRIIFIDTQWFLHLHKKNKIGSVKTTTKSFYSDLDSLIKASIKNGEQVIVAGHHPIYTNGNHSNPRQPARFLINYTPVKIFGWMGLDRVFSQDIDSKRYKKMRKHLLDIINKYENIIYVSGHDHNIQYFNEKNNIFIVSGAGSYVTPLRNNKRFNSVFETDEKTGFVKLQFENNTLRKIEVIKVGEKPFEIGR